MKSLTSSPAFIFGVVILVFIVGGILYIYNPTPTEVGDTSGGVVCTMEAKLCPDGSYVGRSGPNCEFAPCPIPPGTKMEDGTPSQASSTAPVEFFN
jgi:hypothetical protein